LNRLPGLLRGSGRHLYLFDGAQNPGRVGSRPQEDKAFEAALGEDGMKKLDELFAAAVESSESQFFSFSAAMSYPPDEWVKADPEFWKPKAAAVTAAKAEKKTAANP